MARIIVVIALVSGLVSTAVVNFPMGGISFRNQLMRFGVIEGSDLLQGKGLLSVSDTMGAIIVDWEWCPTEGLRSFCVGLSGQVEGTGTVVPGIRGITLVDLGLNASALESGLSSSFDFSGSLTARIQHLPLAYNGACFEELPDATAISLKVPRLRIANRFFEDVHIQLTKSSSGDVADINIAGSGMHGALSLSARGVIAGDIQQVSAGDKTGNLEGIGDAAAIQTIRIKQSLPCRTALD